MSKYIVHGRASLSGEFTPIGNKNAVLKLIPASIIFKGDYVLTNVPAISDVAVMCEMLVAMGADVEYKPEAGYLKINTDNLNTHEVPADLARKVRASVVFAGPLLARFGKVKSPFPGGDKIGVRELTAHFASLMQLGVELKGTGWESEFELEGRPRAGEVFLYEPSVTATENVILAAAKSEGITKIVGAACEPHVKELCQWLAENGVVIEGIGSNILTIHGQSEITAQGRSHEVWTDFLDVGSMIAAAAITDSSLRIHKVRSEDMVTIKYFYEQLGVRFDIDENGVLTIAKGQEMKVQDPMWARVKGIYSQPWFGFPSDLMSMTIAMSLFVDGLMTFTEKLYPDRMSFSGAFEAAGAQVVYCDPRRIIVVGPNQLKPFKYVCPDIRAGMAYLLAALGTEGVSEVSAVEHISRGYPNIVERFNSLGAKIEIDA